VLVVGHSSTTLARGLDLDEPVVLHAHDGEFYAARVAGIEFELEDTLYTFAIGVRLPADLAQERAEGVAPEHRALSLHDLLDLLGELRDRDS
jgi:hypothetical protein